MLGFMGRVGLALALLTTGALAQDEGLPGGPGLSLRGRELARRAQAEAAKTETKPAKQKATAGASPQARRVGTATDTSGQTFDVHAVVEPDGQWDLVVTEPGGTPNLGSPKFDAGRHGSLGAEQRASGPLEVDPDPTPLPTIEPVDPFDLNQPLPVEFFIGGDSIPNSGLAELLRDGSAHSERYSKGIQFYGGEAFRQDIRRTLDTLNNTPTGKKLLDGLNESGKQTVIGETFLNGSSAWASNAGEDGVRRADGKPGPGSNAIVGLGPLRPNDLDDPLKLITAVDIVGHELIHALHYTHGEGYSEERVKAGPRAGTPVEEERTVGLGEFAKEPISENALRRDLNALFPDYHFPRRPAYYYSLTDPEQSFEKVFRPPTKKPAPPAEKPMKGAANRVDELFD